MKAIYWLRLARGRLRGLLRRASVEREMEEELRFHVRMRAAENVRLGMTPEEAERAALRSFGSWARVKEACRDVKGGGVMETLWQDLKFGARTLRKNYGFTVVAVMTLALGIGANTAIFQLLDAVRLRTLPVKDPHELAEVYIADMSGTRGSFVYSHPTVTNPIWERVRERAEPFTGIFAWSADTFNLSTGGESRYAQALWVSGDFFNTLGVRPALGRVFTNEDDRRGCGAPGAVISHAFWQREFGGDPSVVGRKLSLDFHPVEIIGVTPPSFFGPEVGRSFDVAVPICSEATLEGANNRLDSGSDWWLVVMGRLKPGWTVGRAAGYFDSISPGIFEATLPPSYPPDSVKGYLASRLTAAPAGTGVSLLRETYESPLWLLLAIAGIVLLIACANLANLMLARASTREREMAVRLSLGASRARLIRQLLTESLMLAFAGAALGVLLAGALSQFLVSLLSTELNPLFVELNTDWRVLAFTAGLAALTCVLFGLTPAVRATRVAPSQAMKAGGRGMTSGRERFSLRRLLVVAQVALSLVLVVGALLFTRSLGKLLTLDPGLRQDGVVVTSLNLTQLKLPAERRLPFKRELLARIRAVPGVEAAAETWVVPLVGNSWGDAVWMDGAGPEQGKSANFNRVSEGYFKTLGIPLLAGRDFDEHDAPDAPKVAVVNESFAREVAGGANPVGLRLRVEATPTEPETVYEIVGLVKDARYRSLREDYQPGVFLSASQAPRQFEYDAVLIRSKGAASGVIGGVKNAVAGFDPQILMRFQTLKSRVENTLLRERLMATLSGLFGLLALVLACVGLYGIMSYGVAGRTNEIGIRMALGARGSDVRLMILRESLLLVVAGIAVGLPAALAAPRLVSTLLFGLSPSDPASMCLAALSLLVVALAAGYIPARRASRVDPMVALRYE
jgi:putative ABC transport system permease protein